MLTMKEGTPRDRVIFAALSVLEIEGIFEVCTDMLKGLSDSEIEKDFNKIVQNVIDDTLRWEM